MSVISRADEDEDEDSMEVRGLSDGSWASCVSCSCVGWLDEDEEEDSV